MSSPSPSDVEEVLSKRHDWLPYLDDGSFTKSDLCAALGVSRSTVDRGIAGFEASGLIERTPDGYRLTPFGRLLSRLRTSYTNALDTVCRAQAMRTPLPTGQYGEQVLFDEADIVLPKSPLPEKPTRRIIELLTEARSVCGFTPVIHDKYVTVSYEQVMEDELEFEFIVTPPILEEIASLYSEWLVDALDVPAFNIYGIDQIPSFGLTLFENEETCTVVLGVYADNGLSGIVLNDTTRAVGWAKQFYRSYKHAASIIDSETIHKLDF
jgi:predicted transcriptional regulator